MTAYEIRMKIKEEKRIERAEKKAALTTNQIIKNSIKSSKNRRNYQNPSKGNHGTKNKIKQKNLEIKDSNF